MDYSKGSLQIDGENVNDEVKEVILNHPSVIQNQKKIKDLEATVKRLVDYIKYIDEGTVIKKIDEDGNLTYVRF
ncbi:MAG: hypothetical protein GY739_11125 [Mesoflavibacter sp.]|nr:hypothetical protein [Mesoflavibacter sp.]